MLPDKKYSCSQYNLQKTFFLCRHVPHLPFYFIADVAFPDGDKSG
jgi:hypothetical protein